VSIRGQQFAERPIIPQLPGNSRMKTTLLESGYRGRIAPTPSGWLHLGHAATFTTAWRRSRQAGGTLLMRIEDLDPGRCEDAYAKAALEDLRWWGLDWDEGPDTGGPFSPYVQSQRIPAYRRILEQLIATGCAYPSPHSRREIEAATPARSPVTGECLFPARWRPSERDRHFQLDKGLPWRFRVPDGRRVTFTDGQSGEQSFLAGRDFSDFLLWRREEVPSYELAVVCDDHAMHISEVVRGEDLLLSTARQILIYEALGWNEPAWYHCPLVIDPATGQRMAKTHRSLSLRSLREGGHTPGLPVQHYLNLPYS